MTRIEMKELNQCNSDEERRIKEVFRIRNEIGLPEAHSWFNPAYMFIEQSKERNILNAFLGKGIKSLNEKKILDVGCGKGDLLCKFFLWGAKRENLYGIDLMDEEVNSAKQLLLYDSNIHCGNAEKLTYSDATFDIIIQSTVFSSILNMTMKRNVAKEMLRVLKKDGLIIWYDLFLNNPLNPDVKGIRKKELYSLFPNCDIHLRKVTLAPPILGIVGPVSFLLAYLLERLMFLRTHYLGAITKKSR